MLTERLLPHIMLYFRNMGYLQLKSICMQDACMLFMDVWQHYTHIYTCNDDGNKQFLKVMSTVSLSKSKIKGKIINCAE
jgi:hypothetical protein